MDEEFLVKYHQQSIFTEQRTDVIKQKRNARLVDDEALARWILSMNTCDEYEILIIFILCNLTKSFGSYFWEKWNEVWMGIKVLGLANTSVFSSMYDVFRCRTVQSCRPRSPNVGLCWETVNEIEGKKRISFDCTVRWSNFDCRDPKMGVFLQSTEATHCGHHLKWKLTPENPLRTPCSWPPWPLFSREKWLKIFKVL
jgi:hypothetical protein